MDMNNQLPPTPAPSLTAASGAPVSKEIRVPLASLPAGTKAGDTLELTVSSLDPATNMAVLSHEDEDATDKKPEGDEPDGDDTASDEKGPSMDTKTLLGPMNGLKNYLVQKSQDVPKNQGRS